MTTQMVSKQTQKNWWIDATLFSSALVASLSGIYFLFMPSGGYQGGRNPLYNTQILFDRHTWDELHTWSSVIMIIAAVIHLAIHWSWVASMARRVWNMVRGKSGHMNARGTWNLILNAVVGITFILTSLSGLYFLFDAAEHGSIGTTFIFTRAAWDLIHTWAGTLMIIAAVPHFVIHWKWVKNVTRRMFRTINPARSTLQTLSVEE